MIAEDQDDLVAIAARAGRDRGWRADLNRRIEQNQIALFDDPAPVAALMDFLESLP